MRRSIYAPLAGGALLTIDTTRPADLADSCSSAVSCPCSSFDFCAVLLHLDFGPLVIQHLSPVIVRRVCRAWRQWLRSGALAAFSARHAIDARIHSQRGCMHPPVLLEFEAFNDSSTDVVAMAIVANQMLAVADCSGLISLHRIHAGFFDDAADHCLRDGTIGRRLGVLTHHHFGVGDGAGQVHHLLAEGDTLISVGLERNGRGTAAFTYSLRNETVQLLAEGDGAWLRERPGYEESDDNGTEDDDEGEAGSQLVRAQREAERYLHCAALRLPFEDGNEAYDGQAESEVLLFSRLAGLQAALHSGYLYLTPSDPVDLRADFVPVIAMWSRREMQFPSASPVLSSSALFTAVGCVPSRTHEFATCLAAQHDRLFSAHPSGIRVWSRSASAQPLQMLAMLSTAEQARSRGRPAAISSCGARAMTVLDDGTLCAAYGGRVHVWREYSWHGGGVVTYGIVAMLDNSGCICAMLTHGPRLITADTDNGWVTVWDISCCHDKDGPARHGSCWFDGEPDVETPGLIAAFMLQDHLSAVNAIALLPPVRAGGADSAWETPAPAGRLYAGHDSRHGRTKVSCWW